MAMAHLISSPNVSSLSTAVTVPSSESESEASNFKNIVDSVKNFMAVLYQFIYPYVMYGRALLPSLFLDLYVNGVNQVFDFEIDKINKPYLPLASGKLSFRNCVFIVASSAIMGLGLNLMIGSTALIWNFVLCATLWTCYSANTFVLKRPLVLTRSLIVTLLFLTFYATGLSLAKDIPDVEGDIKHGVDSFSARLGQKKVFWISVFLYEIAFAVAFLAGASSSSPFWIKFVTCLGNVVLGSILWYQTKYVDVTNPASTRSFYSLNWKGFDCWRLETDITRANDRG
ncbi:Glycinol 4-dimethylallyltransferase [Vigna angularis]|uniref:Glycinol 4-dimethylallyltransferase n=1 Tax=Phaseolus angularis TaxID=3914 RepID=A0A8T0KTT4_PHAAN|nr:Glycinol 4-dimethylallyltransferase [Vigna angularis]